MLKAAAAPVNRAPTAVADSATTAEDTARTFSASELVGNDTDPNSGDTLSVNSVGGGHQRHRRTQSQWHSDLYPELQLHRAGVLRLPGQGANGNHQHQHGHGEPDGQRHRQSSAHRSRHDGGSTLEDTAKTFTAAQLVGNDTDPNSGDTLSVNSVGGATDGTVVLNANGTVTFTPNANYNGPASFVYRVKDQTGTASTNVATVNMTVTAVNDAPRAVADSFTIPRVCRARSPPRSWWAMTPIPTAATPCR